MNLTQGILTLIVLAVVIWQAPRVQWKTRQARYLVMTLVSCGLAATLHIPAVELIIDRGVNLPHFARVLKYGFAVTMVLFWIAVCLCLAPPPIYRRRWILLLAPFSFGMVLLIWGAEVFSRIPLKGENQNNLYGQLMTITAQTYLFIVIARIGIPVMGHAFIVESELTLRLRLFMLLGSQIGVELMAFHVVVQSVLVLLNIPPGHFGDGVTIFISQCKTLVVRLETLKISRDSGQIPEENRIRCQPLRFDYESFAPTDFYGPHSLHHFCGVSTHKGLHCPGTRNRLCARIVPSPPAALAGDKPLTGAQCPAM